MQCQQRRNLLLSPGKSLLMQMQHIQLALVCNYPILRSSGILIYQLRCLSTTKRTLKTLRVEESNVVGFLLFTAFINLHLCGQHAQCSWRFLVCNASRHFPKCYGAVMRQFSQVKIIGKDLWSYRMCSFCISSIVPIVRLFSMAQAMLLGKLAELNSVICVTSYNSDILLLAYLAIKSLMNFIL